MAEVDNMKLLSLLIFNIVYSLYDIYFMIWQNLVSLIVSSSPYYNIHIKKTLFL